jgi:gas vesicle protein
MRFILGLLLGFGIGFAGAILFAPERPQKAGPKWPGPAGEGGEPAAAGNHQGASGLQSFMRTLREHLDEALAEAREASAQAEREMRARYQKMARRGGAKGGQSAS